MNVFILCQAEEVIQASSVSQVSAAPPGGSRDRFKYHYEQGIIDEKILPTGKVGAFYHIIVFFFHFSEYIITDLKLNHVIFLSGKIITGLIDAR